MRAKRKKRFHQKNEFNFQKHSCCYGGLLVGSVVNMTLIILGPMVITIP